MQIIKSLALALSVAGIATSLPTASEKIPTKAIMAKRIPNEKRHYLIGWYNAEGEEVWTSDIAKAVEKRSLESPNEKRHYLIGWYSAEGEEVWSADIPNSDKRSVSVGDKEMDVEKRHYLIGWYNAEGEETWSADIPNSD